MPGIKDDMLPKLEVEPPSEDEVQAAFDAVLAETEREPSALERLRRLPTPVRAALGVLAGLAIVGGLVAMMGLRGDLAMIDQASFAAGVSALVVSSMLATVIALRGPHRAELGTGGWVLAAALIVLPGLSPLVPGLWEGMPEGPVGWGCLGVGSMATGVAAACVLLLSRWDAPGIRRLVFVGAGAGLMSFAAQQLFCAAGDVGHQLLGHSSLAAVGAIALIALRRVLIR